MTLHALRSEVGDDAFFEIVRTWAESQSSGNVTTDEFIRLAEKISGQQLDELFETWLFTPAKPEGVEPAPGEEAAPDEEAAQLQLAPATGESPAGRMRHLRP